MVDIKYLRTFQKVAELGSYQKAAMYLNYTQSTITFQMQTLEKEFGVQLFEKVGRRMKLTQLGKETLVHTNQILNTFNTIKSLHDQSLYVYKGSLKIALPESILAYKIQPVLKAFRKQAPHVKLSLQALNCYKIQETLLEDKIDLAIHYAIHDYPESITTAKLKTYPISLIASPDLAPIHHDFHTPHQKKPLALLINDNEALFLKIFHHYLNQYDIRLETELDLSSIEAIKQSVKSNIGISFLPTFTVENDLIERQLIELSTPTVHSMTLLYAHHKNKWQSPAMTLFLELLRASL